jgi:putative transposase
METSGRYYLHGPDHGMIRADRSTTYPPDGLLARDRMYRTSPRPSPTWRAFLAAHLRDMVAVDFFVVPTLTFRLLFVFVVLRHDRRELLHLNVTDHATAVSTAQQLVEAFPDDTAPKYLLRDRDGI